MRLRFVLSWVLAPLLVIGAALAGGYWVSAACWRHPVLADLSTGHPAGRHPGGRLHRLVRNPSTVSTSALPRPRPVARRSMTTRPCATCRPARCIGRVVEEMHDVLRLVGRRCSTGRSSARPPTVLRWSRGSATRSRCRRCAMRCASSATSQDGRVWSSTRRRRRRRTCRRRSAAVAIVPGKRLVVAADRPTYVTRSCETVDREERVAAERTTGGGRGRALAGADTALLQTRPVACGATTLRQPSRRRPGAGRGRDRPGRRPGRHDVRRTWPRPTSRPASRRCGSPGLRLAGARPQHSSGCARRWRRGRSSAAVDASRTRSS